MESRVSEGLNFIQWHSLKHFTNLKLRVQNGKRLWNSLLFHISSWIRRGLTKNVTFSGDACNLVNIQRTPKPYVALQTKELKYYPRFFDWNPPSHNQGHINSEGVSSNLVHWSTIQGLLSKMMFICLRPCQCSHHSMVAWETESTLAGDHN